MSPGFRMPPASVVPNAETEEPEPGNPGVTNRVIRQTSFAARNFSIVTRPAFVGSSVEIAGSDTIDLDLQAAYRCL